MLSANYAMVNNTLHNSLEYSGRGNNFYIFGMFVISFGDGCGRWTQSVTQQPLKLWLGVSEYQVIALCRPARHSNHVSPNENMVVDSV